MSDSLAEDAASLEQLIEHCLLNYNAEELRTSAATQLADRLFAAATTPGCVADPHGYDLFALGQLARFYLMRQSASADPDELDQQRAFLCLTHLYWVNPDLVADELRQELAAVALATASSDPPDHWSRETAHITTLAITSGSRQLTGIAITRARLGLELAEPGTMARSALAADLCAALCNRYELLCWSEDLEAAVEAGRRGVAETLPESPFRSLCLNNLAVALRARYEAIGDRHDLDEAINLIKDSIPDAPNDRALAQRYSNLSTLLRLRHHLDHDRDDLDHAVRYARLARPSSPTTDTLNHSDGSSMLNLAAALVERSHTGDHADDLDEAIALLRTILELDDLGPTVTGMSLQRLSGALVHMFRRTQNRHDCAEAIETATRAVAMSDRLPTLRGSAQTCLAVALLASHRANADVDDLEAAVVHARTGCAEVASTNIDRLRALQVLSLALSERFTVSHDRGDLDELIRTNIAAVGVDARVGAMSRATTRDADDDDQQLDTMPLPADTPAPIRRLIELADDYNQRFTVSGDLADLDAAIETTTRALEAAGPADRSWLPVATSYGIRLRVRFEHTGVLDDLHLAIDVGRELLVLAERGWSGRAAVHAHLCGALRLRYHHRGSAADLREAIETGQQGLESDPTPPVLSVLLDHLALAIKELGKVRPVGEGHFDLGVELSRAAVYFADATERGPSAVSLSNLGAQLLNRTDSTVDGIDENALADAIDVFRRAVALTDVGNPDRARYLSNLGSALSLHAQTDSAPALLDEAIAAHSLAVELSASGHPDLCGRLYSLAAALVVKFGRTKDQADMFAALSTFQAATGVETAPTVMRMRAAQQWGRAALSLSPPDHPLAAQGFDAAVALLPRLAWLGLMRHDQQTQLAQWPYLACDSAAAHLSAGSVDRAVESLEQGRSVIWSQILDTRTDLARLECIDKELAARLSAIRQFLDGSQQPRPGS